MGLATFAIEANGDGSIGLMLNGQDLGDRVQSLQLIATPGTLPQLQVRVTGEGQVAGDGIVHVIQTTEGLSVEIGEVVQIWLRELNADSLMEDALRDASPGVSSAHLLLKEIREQAEDYFR